MQPLPFCLLLFQVSRRTLERRRSAAFEQNDASVLKHFNSFLRRDSRVVNAADIDLATIKQHISDGANPEWWIRESYLTTNFPEKGTAAGAGETKEQGAARPSPVVNLTGDMKLYEFARGRGRDEANADSPSTMCCTV